MERDLTIAECVTAVNAFTTKVGPRSKVSIHLMEDRPTTPLFASFRPSGRDNDTNLYVHGTTFREIMAALEAKWIEHRDLHAANTVRAMALKIIEITADQGSCTTASLRADFDPIDIERYGGDACAAATEMASNGPFSIVETAGANR